MSNLAVGFVLAMGLLSAQTGGLHLELNADWRVHDGDDLSFAKPDLDDGGWRSVELPMPYNRLKPGYHWLRRAIDLPAGTDQSSLVLTLGFVADAYEVYWNGIRLGSSGGFAPADVQISRPRVFPAPVEARQAGQRVHIAIRCKHRVVGLRPYWWNAEDRVFLLTGQTNASKQEVLVRQSIERLMLRQSPLFLIGALSLVLAGLVFFSWTGERKQTKLLWLSSFQVAEAALAFLMYLCIDADLHFNRGANDWIEFMVVLGAGAFLEFALAAFDFHIGRARIALWTLVAALPLIRLAGHVDESYLAAFNLPMRLLSAAPLIVAVAGWIRQGGSRQPLASHLFTLTFVFCCLGLFRRVMPSAGFLGLPPSLPIGSFFWPVTFAVNLLFATSLTAQLLRTLAVERKEKQRFAGEFEAARTVQRLLLPVDGLIGNLEIGAVYEPAHEVGGDFYQVIERPGSERILLVGDVSGKGLRAAMLVSVIVGALRREKSSSPAAILEGLNDALVGQTEGGFVTCTCILFALGGHATVSNAGHLAPYLDGREVDVEAGLPLGVVGGAAYNEKRIELNLDSRITIVSDGVVEAANAKGELFGFERTREMSGKSAREIAEAAKAWGQNDDITVVTVRRSA